MTAEPPHRRLNSLTGNWVLVSPHRTQRPWQGKQELTAPPRSQHDSDCYLCPGNTRAGGQKNPFYTDTFVFNNDYPAILEETDCPSDAEAKSSPDAGLSSLFRREAVQGTCRVICFSPRHDLTLPQMSMNAIRCVVDLWVEQTEQLGQKYKWVQVFENKGAVMGCSNPHPHGQIWASNQMPDIPTSEDEQQLKYMRKTNNVMLVDYISQEIGCGQRVVVESDHWVAVVPYWATWPFETLLVPRRHIQRLPDVTDAERNDLASIMKRLLTRYDNLFETSFPYSMGWHGAPFVDGDTSHWQLHAHFFPPLLRSANIKKFMVGYEMLGEPQRDLTPEQAAVRLRDLSDTHYLEMECDQ